MQHKSSDALISGTYLYVMAKQMTNSKHYLIKGSIPERGPLALCPSGASGCTWSAPAGSCSAASAAAAPSAGWCAAEAAQSRMVIIVSKQNGFIASPKKDYYSLIERYFL